MESAATGSARGDAFAYCETVVRDGDKDRFLATLFAPAAMRPHLFALYAFNLEIARVRETVSEPTLGEMKLQWWRDVLGRAVAGDIEAHPVARAVADTITRFSLPLSALLGVIDARVFDLYDDPMPTLVDFEGYAGETSATLLQLAAIVLAGGRDPGTADVAGHGGVAYAISGLLRSFPLHASRGQVYLPHEVLDRHGVVLDDVFSGRATPALRAALADMRAHARRHLDAMSKAVVRIPAETMAAFLPVALVRPYLAAMERADYDPFTSLVEVPQWRRQWTLWRAARRAERVADR